MGVNGLWTVIQPCARPTNLATLNQKRLAVDASIWIYQFLKAVRDKEGNALRNSHVVGFFRRICKLLWFGIRPVFVFDGGAPTLKRQTITGRKQRREGRRDDAVRTAGKLLAVQMQRIAEEEEAKRQRRAELEERGGSTSHRDEPAEELPDAEKLVYVDELGMSQKEKQSSRRFFKQDAYHLPELDGSIESMGRPEDPRIMSIEDLEEYARQFQSGEDINLYDFSKIDFEGEFFKSLPPADRYNILNAARMRSRLRMGLSKEQLDTMFPDRMAFSRFQIERVAERNHLTQRLMKEAGMTGTDLTLGGNNRIAGEKDREYILVKNEGAEGGWALGVVSKEKDRGEIHKPIDVDALDFQYQNKDEDVEMEDDDDFEDVPIEGLNRLPKIKAASLDQANQQHGRDKEEDDSLFVAQDLNDAAGPARHQESTHNLENDEEEDLSRAIALSMRTQHGARSESLEEKVEDIEFEDVPEPQWTQRAVEQAKPVTSASGSMIAHIVNNRANAAIPKPRPADPADSDSEDDLRAAFSKAKKKKDQNSKQPLTRPVPNVKNPFSGPLPFEKLDWKSSIFGKKPDKAAGSNQMAGKASERGSDNDSAGGFEKEDDDEEAPKPLPPWMQQDESDIRDSMKAQRERENEINEADKEAAMEEEKRRRKDAIIEIESSDGGSDIEEITAPLPVRPQSTQSQPESSLQVVQSPASSKNTTTPTLEAVSVPENKDRAESQGPQKENEMPAESSISQAASEHSSPEPEFEEVEAAQSQPEEQPKEVAADIPSPPLVQSLGADVSPPKPQAPESILDNMTAEENDALFGDGPSDDEFSDPEDEELLTQMAAEAEEHARFASQLNNKSEKENQEAYERELKALRTQQKKDRRDADEVTQIMITECQALLRLFGLPYITAPMEAEAQCAELVSLGLVDGIVTDDSDTFLFGGTRVYKNMFNSNKFVECYLGQDLEKELSLSREQLISLAHLLGSDYTEGLPGVGPVTAVEILSEFPGKDGLSEFREWWQDVQQHGRPQEADKASTFRRKFRKAQGKKLFLPSGFPNPAVHDAYMQPEVDHTSDKFEWGVPDVEGLRGFLMSTIGWSQERTDEVLVPVIRDMNRRETEGTQSNITRFFSGSVGAGAKSTTGTTTKEAFAPRQKKKNSKRMSEAVNKLRAKAVVDGMGTAAAGAVDEGNDDDVDDSSTRRRRSRRRGGGTGTGGKKRKAGSSSAPALDDDDGEDGEGEGEEMEDPDFVVVSVDGDDAEEGSGGGSATGKGGNSNKNKRGRGAKRAKTPA